MKATERSDAMNFEPDDFNKGGMVIFVLGMTVVGLFILYISFIHPGVDLGEQNQEALRLIALPAGDSTPWVSTAGQVIQGGSLYATYCAMCHGPKGLGDGLAGSAMKPAPRNIVTGQWTQDGSPLGLYQTVSMGISGTAMAAYGHLSMGDRWAIVHFLSSITNNKVPNDQTKLEEFIKKQK